MKKKIFGIFVCIILVTTLLPIAGTVIAGSEDNPEVEDRIFDVKLFGIFLFPLQIHFKYADVVSTWFYENSDNPDYLYVSLKIRDLGDKADDLEVIYDVDWSYSNNRYICCVHDNPNGYGPFVIGKSADGDENYDDFAPCEGNFDVENNIISWKVPKIAIGDPLIGHKLTSISPHTHLRFRDDSELPHMDLFKDLYWNVKTVKDYLIQC